MPYHLTKLYVGIVITVMSILAIMAAIVFALGGRVNEEPPIDRVKGLPAEMTVPTERLLFNDERVERSPQSVEPVPLLTEEINNDDSFNDVEDFGSDYKITRLTKPNSKYYSIAYRMNDDDEDRFLEDSGSGDSATIEWDDSLSF